MLLACLNVYSNGARLKSVDEINDFCGSRLFRNGICVCYVLRKTVRMQT